MAYPKDFTSITMNGTLASGNEIWSAGLHVMHEEASVPSAQWRALWEPIADDVAAIMTDFYTDPRVMTPTDAPMTSVKIAHLGTDGKYIEEALEVATTAPGTRNENYLPQGTLVSTLVSLKFKDPGKYNRFYLPISPFQLGAGWRLSTGKQAEYAACVVEMVNALNALFSTSFLGDQVFVGVLSSAGAGHENLVNSVRIGAIVDTQRRRRNKLPEQYVEDFLT